jgi:radical SAM superfamily enzyme YgiQ (UPF0313 family)
MVYKNGPPYRVRPVEEIKEDLRAAQEEYGDRVRTVFFPAGNTIAMKTDQLSDICRYTRHLFPHLERITVYGSSHYMQQKGREGLQQLAEAGLNRIHVGLESGDDTILKRICKGATSEQHITAGQWAKEAGIELSMYVILGIGGAALTERHASETARVLNAVGPDYIRLRTFVPKMNTPLLKEVRTGSFEMLGPHGILDETAALIKGVTVHSYLTSDHYTNYVTVEGQLPGERERMLAVIARALQRDVSTFRPFFVGTE